MTRRPNFHFGCFGPLRVFGLLLLAWALAACGDASTTDRSDANIRLVNATGASGGYPQLALRLNDVLKQGQVAYGESAPYLSVDDGSSTLTISAQGATSNLLSSSVSLTKGRYYTALAYGRLGSLQQVLLDDNQSDPDVNKSLLRVVNAAPDLGSLDVYLLAAGEELASAVAVQASAGYGAVGDWKTLNSGSWRLVVTAASNRSDVRLDQSGVDLSSRQIGTLVLSAGSGGVLANAVLLSQRDGNVKRLDNPQARVRVAAGLDGAGAVTVNANGTPLVSGAASPSLGNYALSTTVSNAYALTVASSARSITGAALQAGADYSLLVYGNTASATGTSPPQAVWLSDVDSTRSSTNARIRLVNGLSDPSSRLSLTVDFVPVAGSIAPGSASASYADTPPGTTISLRVTREGDSAPLFTASGQTLNAGSTYSVFVLGSVGGSVGIVRRDR